MKRSLVTFSVFFVAQLLLWVASRSEYNIASGGEILIETIVVSIFVLLFFNGYRWARWVAAVLLGFIGLVIGTLTFDGLGLAFLSVALLYGAVIITLFRYSPAATTKGRPIRPDDLEADVIDWLPTQETISSVRNTFQVGEETYEYPLLVKRYQSVLIDFVLWFTVMIIAMVIMGESESRQTVMVSMGVVFAFLYEPIMTTYAATLGQYIIGIRVRNARNPEERINIFQAYIRIIVKWLLGWLSFVTINFNPQHRAIHDLAGLSVVIRMK